jgi:hypothetical protein
MVEQPQQCQAALQALLAQRVDALLVNVPLDDPTPNSSGRWRRPFRCCSLMSRPQRR